LAAAFQLHTQQARGEVEHVPLETGKMTGKMERYSNMRANPSKSIGFSAAEASAKITVPALFVVAENEELSNNDIVAAVQKELAARGVPSKYHVVKGITHYGIYREGFEEATALEIAWFEEHLKGAMQGHVGLASRQSATGETPVPPAGPAPGSNPVTPSIEEGFVKLDTDQNGKLNAAEFGKLKETAKYFRENPDHLEPAFQRLDADKDGALTLEEYRQIAKPRTGKAGEAPKPAPTEDEAGKSARAPVPTDADLAFFEKNIRPVLIKSCYECHSAEADKLKAGLALDGRDALLKGGDSGSAVVPGKPEESLLIASLRYDDPDLQMPPEKHGGKLSDGVIANFVEWVKRGAPMPEGESVEVAEKMEARMDHWAFKPVQDSPAPAVTNTSWPRTEVDRFVLAELEKKGLAPVADAEPAALLRRVHLDLTGLPPTAEQVTAFLAAPSESRIEGVIDELMKSPRFGERWGRHWLDVARYAESSGKETDFAYPHAWRYRDYVIASFNEDKPFDRFIREQIAGDLLEAADEKERAELLIATGFLAIGPKSHIEKNPIQFEMDVVDEQIDTVSQAFLGMTMACARCHDHKYDPFPTRDYYALAGIFQSTRHLAGTETNTRSEHGAGYPLGPDGELRLRQIAELSKKADEAQATYLEIVKQRNAIREPLEKQGIDWKKNPTPELTAAEAEVQRHQTLVKAAREAIPAPPEFAMAVLDAEPMSEETWKAAVEANEKDRKVPLPSRIANSPIYEKGLPDQPLDPVPRGVPGMFAAQLDSPRVPGQTSGRLELADWLTDSRNPLTARVYVNRVWHHLFGAGLVRTVDNFGLLGEAPSHPELLDDLALRFMSDEMRWSTKALIRTIMLSRAWRLDSVADPTCHTIDPDNRWHWRFAPQPLEAESLRDSLLFVAGKLDLTPLEGSQVAEISKQQEKALQREIGRRDYYLKDATADVAYRSVYLPVARSAVFDVMTLFDMPDPNLVSGARSPSTVPTQALFLMNSPLVTGAAESGAENLLKLPPQQRLRASFESMLGREPSPDEILEMTAFLESAKQESERDRWSQLWQALAMSAEFRTIF
ncbi:MAG: DUF1549 domain-containing protein, partial [Verrucomicrobiae bacterium]|nr:DUF1549 domain-containing protein [Verrucomicrobiae bacterium]